MNRMSNEKVERNEEDGKELMKSVMDCPDLSKNE